MPGFSTSVPAGNSGLMFFDVTYTAPTRCRACSPTRSPPRPTAAGQASPQLTNPVPVGCQAGRAAPAPGRARLDRLRGCCTFAAYHRTRPADQRPPAAGGAVAIDFEQAGPNNACCNGPPESLRSWWGYDTPVLAAAPGVAVAWTVPTARGHDYVPGPRTRPATGRRGYRRRPVRHLRAPQARHDPGRGAQGARLSDGRADRPRRQLG